MKGKRIKIMAKNPETYEFVECPTCEGTGVDNSYGPLPYFDEEFGKEIADIDDYPADRMHEFICSKCEGTKQVEIDELDEEGPCPDFARDLANDY